MVKITEIYVNYKIPPNLKRHQLRVASIAMQICDSLDVAIDKNALATACLLHDMGNVVKFDLSQTKSIFGFSDKEIKEIKEVQEEFIEKYGKDEYEANTHIAKELNLPERVIELISKNRFHNLCIDKDGDDWELKVMHYADSRVSPLGIVSYDERMTDAGNRYRTQKGGINEVERQKLVDCGKDIESQIFSHSNIKPEDITGESIQFYMEKLKDFEI